MNEADKIKFKQAMAAWKADLDKFDEIINEIEKNIKAYDMPPEQAAAFVFAKRIASIECKLEAIAKK